ERPSVALQRPISSARKDSTALPPAPSTPMVANPVAGPTSGVAGVRAVAGSTSGTPGVRVVAGPTSGVAGVQAMAGSTSGVAGVRAVASSTSGTSGVRVVVGAPSGAANVLVAATTWTGLESTSGVTTAPSVPKVILPPVAPPRWPAAAETTPSLSQSVDQRLQTCLDLIRAQGFSLTRFLTSLFMSEASAITQITNKFISERSHEQLFKIWLRHPRSETFLLGALFEPAVEAIALVVRGELRALHNEFETTATSLTRKEISGIRLEEVWTTMEDGAPTLTTLLSRCLNMSTRKQSAIEKISAIAARNRSDDQRQYLNLAMLKQDRHRDWRRRIVEKEKDVTPAGFCNGDEGIISIISMLMSRSARASNRLQMRLGLYFKSTRTSQRTMKLLSRIGLSVSPDTTRRALKTVSTEAMKEANEKARTTPGSLLFDNLDYHKYAFDQTIDNRDTSSHGALGTFVCNVTSPTTDFFRQRPLPRPTVWDFLPDIKHAEHQKVVTFHHIMDTIRQYTFPDARWNPPSCSVEPLEVRKTETYPLPAMPYSQSDLDGVLAALKDMMHHVGWDSDFIDHNILV
ncbi:hypothetical protein DFQ26_001109, partial [Actinomortierella ambigua]